VKVNFLLPLPSFPPEIRIQSCNSRELRRRRAHHRSSTYCPRRRYPLRRCAYLRSTGCVPPRSLHRRLSCQHCVASNKPKRGS